MRRAISVVMLFLVGLGASPATAQPAPQPAPPPYRGGDVRPAPPTHATPWDSRGWVQLGERMVNRNVDRDRIEVGRYEGQFSKLTVVVLDSDLEMLDFTITFGDRTTYSPKLAHVFREGQRSRAFDLPPSGRAIRHIDVRYRNLAGGGRARVQIWGWKTGENAPPPVVTPVPGPLPPPPPPAPAPQWDQRGWTMLGERLVDRHIDADRIDVGRYEGKFTKLQVVVLDSDLELLDLAVKFGRGPEWRPDSLRHYFREGQRTRAIDFPGDERVIKHVDFRYRNLPGGGRARVQIWGYRADAATPSLPPGQIWDNRGWTMLGERAVQGRRGVDRDKLFVRRWQGSFRKLMIVVVDSDLEMVDVVVKFARGPAWRPEVTQLFREGTRTRAIDLPGDQRVIKWIEFRYRNLPGGGRARVQVWAK